MHLPVPAAWRRRNLGSGRGGRKSANPSSDGLVIVSAVLSVGVSADGRPGISTRKLAPIGHAVTNRRCGHVRAVSRQALHPVRLCG